MPQPQLRICLDSSEVPMLIKRWRLARTSMSSVTLIDGDKDTQTKLSYRRIIRIQLAEKRSALTRSLEVPDQAKKNSSQVFVLQAVCSQS